MAGKGSRCGLAGTCPDDDAETIGAARCGRLAWSYRPSVTADLAYPPADNDGRTGALLSFRQ